MDKDVPDAVRWALRMLAATNKISTQAEMRFISEPTLCSESSESRLKLGSRLKHLSHSLALDSEDVAILETPQHQNITSYAEFE